MRGSLTDRDLAGKRDVEIIMILKCRMFKYVEQVKEEEDSARWFGRPFYGYGFVELADPKTR